MSVSHIIGTLVLIFHIILINGQRPGQFRRRIPMVNFPPGPGTRGVAIGGAQQIGRPQFGQARAFGGMVGGPSGINRGFNLPNIPPPPGFQQISRNMQNTLPIQLRNALPRNSLGGGGAGGVNSVLNGQGFTTRFGPARGQELTRQLSPAPPGTFGGFAGGGGGAAAQNFPGLNRIQGLPPNFAMQMGPGIGAGQQRPGAALGARNQPQAVMPRQVGTVNMGSMQPGQRLGNEPAGQPRQPTFNFPPQTAQAQPSTNQFAATNPFAQQPQQPQQPAQQTFGTRQSFGTQQSFGAQQPFGTQQPFRPQQTFRPQTGTQGFVPQSNFGAQQTTNTFQQGAPIGQRPQRLGPQPSFAFPQQQITQPIGVGRPASQVSVPQGAPQLLPGELEIAPPISPAAAAAIQGGGSGNAPPSVSEIITISDINGNVLYRGVDLSDAEIEKITTQLVNNMSDSQAADAAARGRELESQGKLDTVGNPLPMPTNQQQQQPQGVQNTGNQGLAAQGQQRFTGGQGFSSWGQGQGLRFPGSVNAAPGRPGR